MTDYAFDSSIWIHAGRFHPPDIFSGLWRQVDSAVSTGLIRSPEEVREELRRGSDELGDNLAAKIGLFVPLEPDVMTAVRGILSRFPEFADADSERNRADPFVVAYASLTGRTVVTNEKPRRPASSRPKIPDVCQDLGIPYVDWFGFLRAVGWEL